MNQKRYIFLVSIFTVITAQAYKLASNSVNLLVEKRSAEILKKDAHLRLTSSELHQLFGNEDSSQVPSYEVVYPSLVDQNARRSTRARRSLHDKIPMFMHFKAFDTDFHLNLTKNKYIAPDIQIIEHHNDEGITRLKGRSATHSIGKIVSDESSIVALDHLNGLNGIILRGNDVFAIAPVPDRLNDKRHSIGSLGAHIIYKKSSPYGSQQSKEYSCGVHDQIQNVKKSMRSLRRERRSTSSRPEKTMELMIAADKHMVAFHGKEFLQSYLLTLGNIVAGLFKDKSLAYPITVVVTRIVTFETDVFQNASSVEDLLHKFTAWVDKNNPKEDSDPLHVDNAVLMTKGGCADGCKIAGFAVVGMCQHSYGHSAVKDLGLMGAINIAHEIGHNLGLVHDSSTINVNCSNGVYIMSSGGVDPEKAFEWSPCSSNTLAKNFESSSSWCFNDKPSTNNYPMNTSFQMYGQVYNGDKQCQIAFNSKYTHCTHFAGQQDCSRLQCKRPDANYCDYTMYPPAHGTWCGDHMWCIYGACVKDGTTPSPPIDGGWSEFSEYTVCNRKCGGGVQWRSRTCTNPAPKYGGKNCVGDSKGHWKTCSMQPCAAGTESFRTEQCKAIATDKYYIIDASQPCKLICASPTGAAYFYGNVKDGTFATATGPDICIQGVSRKVGCDLVLESGSIQDRCSKCGGDGSSCVPVSFVDMNRYANSGDYDIATVPAGSKNILIREMHPTYDFIGVKVGTSNNLAYYIPSWSTSLKVAGADLVYTMEDYNFPDQIKITGTINDKIRIFFINYYWDGSKGITWNYYKPSDGNTSAMEYAVSSEWGACSKTCAGGKQTRQLICRRVDDKTAVSISFCSSLVKPATEQPCNTQACPPQWHLSEWSSCSKSCATGQKTRNLTCSELRADQKYYPVENVSLCTSTKPTEALILNCNEVICPSKWVPGNWGECNTTCGLGTKTRSLYCERTNKDGSKAFVRDLECSYLSKPAAVTECNIDNPCPTWFVEFSSCSQTCGGGLQYPYLVCRVSGSKEKFSDSQCSADEKPDLSKYAPKSCNTHVCVAYEWKTVEGTCSVSCGNGTIPITVTCLRNTDNVTVADEYCMNTTKPSTYKLCDAGECPEIYKWKLIKGSCSVTCGNGTFPSIAACFRQSDAAKVDDILCEASVKPSPGEPSVCVMEPCPEVYKWNATYSACSVTCSVGTKTPIIKCVKESNVLDVVSDSLCMDPRPNPGSVSCNMGECPPSYSWKEHWSKCNVTCGSGYKTSYFKCFMDGTNTEMDDSYCTALSKPEGTTMQCSIPCNYEWVAVYGDCVTTCGSGYKMMKLTCQHVSNKTVASDSKCIEEKLNIPPQQQCSSLPECLKSASSSDELSYYDVGCYKDNYYDRHLPYLVVNLRNDIKDWYNLSSIINSCAKTVANPETKKKYGKEFPFFAIQYYGECWAGDASTEQKYYLSGSSTNCYLGTGGQAVNYVYHFRSTIRTTQIDPVLSVGCFNDNGSVPRPLPVLIDNFRNTIDWNKPFGDTAATIIKKCAIAAARRKFTYFGIQHYGECWSGSDAQSTYKQDGSSNRCKDGVGGTASYFVYRFLKTQA